MEFGRRETWRKYSMLESTLSLYILPYVPDRFNEPGNSDTPMWPSLLHRLHRTGRSPKLASPQDGGAVLAIWSTLTMASRRPSSSNGCLPILHTLRNEHTQPVRRTAQPTAAVLEMRSATTITKTPAPTRPAAILTPVRSVKDLIQPNSAAKNQGTPLSQRISRRQ